jgi:hypothetical protein
VTLEQPLLPGSSAASPAATVKPRRRSGRRPHE